MEDCNIISEVHMELSYKLEKFEGPLDLLLQLIEKNKVKVQVQVPFKLLQATCGDKLFYSLSLDTKLIVCTTKTERSPVRHCRKRGLCMPS